VKRQFLANGIAFALLGFFVITPYSIFDFGTFSKGMAGQFLHYAIIGHGAEDIPGFIPKFRHDFNFLSASMRFADWGIWILWLSLPIELLRHAMKRPRSPLPLLLLYPTLYLLFMGKMRVAFDRNLLLVFPFIAIVLAYWTASVLNRLPPVLRDASGLALFLYLFGGPIHNAYAQFPGVTRYDADTRTILMTQVKSAFAPQAGPGNLWIVKESMIHPEETKGYEDRFLYIGAQEAVARLKKGERPALVITTDLESYPAEVLAANRALLGYESVMRKPGSSAVSPKVYVANPTVYALRVIRSKS
jgi:hypothetical protein